MSEVTIYNEGSIKSAVQVVERNSAVLSSDWYGLQHPALYYSLDLVQLEDGVCRFTFAVSAYAKELTSVALHAFSDCATTDRFREGLWHDNVFEAFFYRDNGYLELHLSPDGHWWVSDFSHYRVRAKNDISKNFSINTVQIEHDNTIVMTAISFNVTGDSADYLRSSKFCFLSAVIRVNDNQQIFYTLGGKKTGRPDFHNSDNALPIRKKTST
ncbi:MAG: hypothetical protein PHC51_06280 [bacterium]|nr:hypothetical protein [bacterium]